MYQERLDTAVPAYISGDGHTRKKEGQVLCQPGKKIQREPLVSGHISELPAPTDVTRLQNQIDKLQNKVNILHETIHVLKKDPGTDMRELSNREKAVIVSALKENYPLPLLLHEFDLPGSSYFYQISTIRQPDKYAGLRTQMRKIFHENRDCYGYRRIWHMLQDRGIIISEKIIRRIMKEDNLAVSSVKHKKWGADIKLDFVRTLKGVLDVFKKENGRSPKGPITLLSLSVRLFRNQVTLPVGNVLLD